MYMTPKASFIYTARANIFVYKNNEGIFQILHKGNLEEFNRNFIKGWLGQKDIVSIKKDRNISDLSFKLDQDRYITFNDKKCTLAEIMVITSPKLKCEGQNIIKYQDFKAINSLVVYCDDKQCSTNISKK